MRSCSALELGDLQAMGFDLALTGFATTNSPRCSRTATPGLTDPDDVPGAAGRAGQRPRATSGCSAGIAWSAATAPIAATVAQGAERRRAASDGHRPALRRGLRPGLARRGRRQQATGRKLGKVRTTTGPTGARPGRCFPGDVAYVWHGALHASEVIAEPGGVRLRASARRSSGTRTGSCSAAATITGSTSRAGTRCAGQTATGPATASRPRSGRSRHARIATPATARRSRSSA